MSVYRASPTCVLCSHTIHFASYEGTVIAGRDWGSKMTEMTLPPAQKSSIEYMLHKESSDNRLLLFDDPGLKEMFNDFMGHRAIGVVYNPEYDNHQYVPTLLPYRYDALIYLDKTTALHPLHIEPNGIEVPETYPFGV
jgi:erythromycin esterase